MSAPGFDAVPHEWLALCRGGEIDEAAGAEIFDEREIVFVAPERPVRRVKVCR